MNSWTIVLVAAVVICCGVVQCDKDAFMAVVKDCAKENNVSDEQMKEMKEKSKSPDFVPSEAGKCMAKCMINKFGMVKDGKLDGDHIKQWAKEKEFDMAKVQAAIDECGPLYKGAGTCEEAYQLSKCLKSHKK